MERPYTFIVKFDHFERKVLIYDQCGIWIGSIFLYSGRNVVCTLTDHSNYDSEYEARGPDNRPLTFSTLTDIAIDFAATSGIDEDIIDDMKFRCDIENKNFILADILYVEKEVMPADDEIFNFWMNR